MSIQQREQAGDVLALAKKLDLAYEPLVRLTFNLFVVLMSFKATDVALPGRVALQTEALPPRPRRSWSVHGPTVCQCESFTKDSSPRHIARRE